MTQASKSSSGALFLVTYTPDFSTPGVLRRKKIKVPAIVVPQIRPIFGRKLNGKLTINRYPEKKEWAILQTCHKSANQDIDEWTWRAYAVKAMAR